MSDDLDAARRRLARAQHDLLSALVEDTPPPPGFDPARLALQRDVLLTKRLRVVAKVAPELAGVLGDRYRPLFLAYATGRPQAHGYRRDARDFARHLLRTTAVAGEPARRLAEWSAAAEETTRPGPLRRLTAALSTRRTKGGDR